MSKTIKRILSVLLCAALLFGAVPLDGFVGLRLSELSALFAPVAHAEDDPTSGTCGENLTWEYDTSTATLTISGTGMMKNYNYNSSYITTAPWGTFSLVINTVVINDGVKSIGDYVFYNCSNLTSVILPNSVTNIGVRAFFNCSNLISITIPNSIISVGAYSFTLVGNVVYHGTLENAPWGARALNGYVEYPFVYTDSTKNTLLACVSSYQGDISIPDSVTSIGDGAFDGCTGLTSVTIPNSVTSIGDEAFHACKGLTSVTIPDNVTSIGDDAFSDCTGLTSVTIPDSVTSIGYGSFMGCAGLTSVTIPDSVTSIGRYAFAHCTGLTSVTIGSGVTSIGEHAFYLCTKLNSVNIYDLEAWCNIKFELDSSNPLCYAHNLYLKGNLVTDLVFPKSVMRIGQYAFFSCSSLTTVILPDSVTHIGYEAFYACTGLTSAIMPDGVTSIGNYAFEDCSGLTSVTIPDSVTSIGYGSFMGCAGLTSVTIGNSVKSVGLNSFYRCKNITDIYYYGSPEEWAAIKTDSGNDYLLNATIHYIYDPNNVISPTGTRIKNIELQQYVYVNGTTLSKTIGGDGDIHQALCYSTTITRDNVKADDFTWTSGDESILKVTGSRFSAYDDRIALNVDVLGVSPGTTTLTVTTSDGASASCKVTVVKDELTVVSATPESNSRIEYNNGAGIDFRIEFSGAISLGSGSVKICEYETGRVLRNYSTDSDSVLVDDVQPNELVVWVEHPNCWRSEEEPIPFDSRIYIKIDQTAIIPVDNSLDFNGINDKDTLCYTTGHGLQANREIFAFFNHNTSTDNTHGFAINKYTITPDLQQYLIEKGDRKTETKLRAGMEKTWNGSCFGMSSVIILNRAGKLNLGNWDVRAANCYDMAFPRNSTYAYGVQDLINYYQLAKKIKSNNSFVFGYKDDFFSNYKKALETIVTRAKNLSAAYEPFEVGFSWTQDGKEFGHSCVACGYYESNGCHYVVLYDPSAPKQTQTAMEISLNYDNARIVNSSWILPNYELNYVDSIDAEGLSAFNISPLNGSKAAPAKGSETDDELTTIEFIGISGTRIQNQAGQSLEYSNGTFSGNMPVYSIMVSAEGDHAATFTITTDPSEKFIFTTSADEALCTLDQGDVYISVSAENTAAIELRADNSLRIEGNQPEYNIFMTGNIGSNTVQITGQADTYTEIKVQEAGLAMSGDSDSNVNVTNYKNTESISNAVLISEEEKTVSDPFVERMKHTIQWVVDGVISESKELPGNAIEKPADPTKTGYTFKNWTPNIPATMPEEDLTFTAVWEINKSTLKVEPNGGMWNDSTTEQTFTQNYNAAKTITDPTRTGYTFTGWTLSNNPNGNFANGVYTFGAQAGTTDTLTAQWERIVVTLKSIAVKTKPNKTTYTVGETLNTDGLTLTATYSDDSAKTITNGFTCNPTNLNTAGTQTITVNYEGKTTTFMVTVNEETPTTYTLTFNANGGSGAPANQTGNGVITLSTTKPTRDGYTFKGWATSASATAAQYQPGTSYNLTGNVTLYAVWQKNDTPPAQPKVRSVSLGDVTVNFKSKTTLKPQITAADGAKYTVSYSSSDPSIVKVNEKTGEVTGAKKGSATIICTVTDQYGNTVSDTCKVTVKYTAWQWVIIILLFGWIWYK